MNCDNFFTEVEKFKAPSTILFRSIELKFLKEKLNQISTNCTILDLGCGDGLTASLAFDKKIDYGLDNDKNFVELARKSGVYKQVLLADARKIPLENNCVDLVFSNCVIEHIKELGLVLSEVSRVLKKGGLFIFTTPSHTFNNYSIFSRLCLNRLSKFYSKLRDKKFSHYNCFSLKKWAQALKKSKLEVVDGYYYIDKRTAEFWDLLLVAFFLLNVNKLLSNWAYNRLFRKRIYFKYRQAKKTSSNGAAVAIFARKI